MKAVITRRPVQAPLFEEKVAYVTTFYVMADDGTRTPISAESLSEQPDGSVPAIYCQSIPMHIGWWYAGQLEAGS
jgi:hypothetical protein